jgi:hypothetical protein
VGYLLFPLRHESPPRRAFLFGASFACLFDAAPSGTKKPAHAGLPFSFALLHHSLPGLILAWLKLPSSAASSVFT